MNSVERRLHERTLELAASAIDFELTSAETSELEGHLAVCSRCSRDAVALREDSTAMHLPMGLLPSRRVDEAVYREIARGEARPQGFILLVAAALLLLGLLAAVAVGAALLDRDTLPITLVPPASVINGEQQPDASRATRAPVGETWQTLDVQAGASGGLIEAVTFVGAELVGVGRVGCAGDPADDPTGCYGAAWTAGVGDSLTRVPDHDGLRVGIAVPTSGPEKGLFDVASGPAGVVAIGYPLDDELGGPRIWQSSDGRTWQRVGFAFGPSGEQARFSSIASGARGYVIVGWVIGDTPRAAAWVSRDGLAWTRAADTEIMDVGPCLDTGEEPSCGGMMAVTATASGFVAVGHVRSEANDRTHPAAWTSPDGLSWTRSDAGLDFDGQLSGVTDSGSGLVAVGTICQPSCSDLPTVGGVAATSPDGSIWTVSMVVDATGLSDVAFADGKVFALGVNVVDEPPAHLQLWRTDDGVAWRQVAGLPSIADAVSSYRAVDIAGTDDRLVVVGWAETSGAGDFQNFAYFSPPADSVAPSTDAPPPTPPTSPTPAPSLTGSASSIDPIVLLLVRASSTGPLRGVISR